MFRHLTTPNSVEVLESRIAPAAVIGGTFKAGQVGSRIELHAGEGLSTGVDNGGIYLLFVEKGDCLVFTTDLNNNGLLDYNEITGIAAGDGLRLISFVDIHGDIVTNLKPNGFLSDSDNNSANDPPALGGDGRVLLNSTIEKIELRSLTTADVGDINKDGVVDQLDVSTRLALSSYSIFGNIYAGAGFGADDGGLVIDSSGFQLQQLFFSGDVGNDLWIKTKPGIGSIKVGTAVGDDYFSFGASRANDTQGFMIPFVPQPGVAGGGIKNIHAATTSMEFTIHSLEAGNGGTGAKGGDITNVTLFGDDAGGYRIIAGNGGRGPNGGNGGAIVNLADNSSVTSLILIKSGDGGEGLTGRGGDGGTITLGNFKAAGNMNIELGSGGTGFLGGGNGASFPSGAIVNPAGPDATTSNIVSSWHNPTVLGSSASIDFDLDGVGDYVFTSGNPGQLVVVLGGPLGERIYLDGLADAEALTVGDFNGDGHPDIATGSSNAGSFAGVRTFLSVYRDLDGDGIKETFVGFSRAIDSPLPSIFTYNDVLFQSVYRSANPITDIAAGDFNGDGVTDLAVTATYRDIQDTSTEQFLIILRGDSESTDGLGNPLGTGSFYADFGSKEDKSTNPPTPANFFRPFVALADDQTTATIEAVRTSLTANHDVVIGAINGQKSISVFDNYFAGAGGSLAGPLRTSLSLGQVDVDRSDKQAFTDATFRDFTAVDFNGDGFVDIALILQDPGAFMITFKQSAAGTFSIDSGTADNAGIRLGSNGLNLGDTYVSIRLADANNDTKFNEIALLNYSAPNDYFSVNQLRITTGAQGATVIGSLASGLDTTGRSEQLFAFDVYPSIAPSYGVGVNTGDLHLGQNRFMTASPLPGGGALFSSDLLMEYEINLTAGNGGGSLIGKGGNGGSLGSGLKGSTVDPLDPNAVDPTGTVSLTFSPTRSLVGTHTLIAGTGGNGFSAGGNGGAITGVSARDSGNSADDVVSLLAGDGGFGVSGAGGAGGSLTKNSIQRGILFTAGAGGTGKVGGAGGSIVGNGIGHAYDSQTPQLTLTAGIGGDGVKAGGAGGSISNFVMRFPILNSGVSGPLVMTAGNGGNAVSGKGGNGGSVTNSSPLDDENTLADEVFVQAGDGGNGASGGNGGSIANFVDHPTIADTPTILTFIAGNGGAGTTGKGGNGGNVLNVITPSTGEPGTNGFLSPSGGFTFDRILAGNGGSSSANAGGKGGNVSGINVSSSSGAITVVAGAGGSGLQLGGAGGSVLGNTVSSGGPDTGGKVLVIAGAGGDASAFVANPNDRLDNSKSAFGGKIGRGGNGGDIRGFVQDLSIDVSVDLIAGNGGSTVNYGNSNDSKAFVGKGGSVMNINVAGSIGTIDPTHKIIAYNDTDGDGKTDITIADWVTSFLRDPLIPQSLGDGVGNVGIIAGAAGRIKAIEDINTGTFITQPAPGAAKLNGSVQNITARLLMSAVAGDVNQIAAIHAAKNINIASGLVGADKDPTGPLPDYRDADGNIIHSPVLGGGLLDGAFISDSRVPEIDGKPRVFVL